MSASPASKLASLPDSTVREFLASLSEERMAALRWDWKFWARPEQLEPQGDWNTWLVIAGRGFGKTRLGAEWVREQVCGDTPMSPGKCARVALVGETAADVRDVIVQGPSGILKTHPEDFRPRYVKSDRCLYWPNGAIALLFSAEEPDQLRGPEHDAAWCDETAKWRYATETFDQLQFGLRVGDKPRQLITTTPRPIPIIKNLMGAAVDGSGGVVVTRGSTFDNSVNLAPTFVDGIRRRYEGTRLGRQELNAEILDDLAGALWDRRVLETRSDFNPTGAGQSVTEGVPQMTRVVVAIDPSGTKGDGNGADDVGVIVAGKSLSGDYWVLEDATCSLGPVGWAKVAIGQYRKHEADCVVAETNYGGAMVENTLRMVDRDVPFVEVKASRGKHVRAEPVSTLYGLGKVRHVRHGLSALEDELCNFTTSGYVGSKSPNRADALVWAISELALGDADYDRDMWIKLNG